MVSVIMLTYNHEQYIKQAIDSVLMQKTSFQYEIIIGDDCSSDATVEILKEYAQKHPDVIKLILRTENLGVTKNIYDLCMKCKGKYIAFLEGDDYWTDFGKLEEQVSFLENHPGYSGVAHDFEMVDNAGNIYPHRKTSGEYTSWKFKMGLLPGQTGTLCFVNFLHDGKDDYKIVENASNSIGDRTFVLLMLLHGKVYTIDKKMSVYRVFSSPTSWSQTLGKGAKGKNPHFDDICYYKKLTDYSEMQWKTKQSALCNKSYCVFAAAERYLQTKSYEDKRILHSTYTTYDESKILLFVCCAYLFLRKILKKKKR